MRKLLKTFLFFLLDLGNAPALFLALQKNKGFIALYHGVAPTLENYGIYNYRHKFILPDSFRSHLAWYQTRFHIVSLSSFIELSLRGEKLPKPLLAITFDDGYENVYRYAFPLLKEFGIPATVFLTTDLVERQIPLWVDRLEHALGHTNLHKLDLMLDGRKHSFPLGNSKEQMAADIYLRDFLKKIPDQELKILLSEIESRTEAELAPVLETTPYRGLTWEKIRLMAKGKIEFAPHTLSHPILSRLSSEEAKQEIIQSHSLLQERLGTSLPIFAYPNGQLKDFSEATIAVLKRLGFSSALTTIPGTISPKSNPFALPRFSMDGSDDPRFFRLTISGTRKHLGDFLK